MDKQGLTHNSLLLRVSNSNPEELKNNIYKIKNDEGFKDFLISILHVKIDSSTKVDLQDPNWTIKRAFSDGANHAYSLLLTILLEASEYNG